MTVTGFPDDIIDPDCVNLNGTFLLRDLSDQPEVAPNITTIVPEQICILDLAVDCWFQAEFDGPDGQRWFWEIGFTFGTQTISGEDKWQVVVALSSADLQYYILYKGPLTGGFIDSDDPFDQLSGVFTFNGNHCASQSPPCAPLINETIDWNVDCGASCPEPITCRCCSDAISHECMYMAISSGAGGFFANPAALDVDCADLCANTLNDRCFRLRRHSIDICIWVLDGLPAWIDPECFPGFDLRISFSDCDQDPVEVRPLVVFQWLVDGDAEIHVFRGTFNEFLECAEDAFTAESLATYVELESNPFHCAFNQSPTTKMRVGFGDFLPECPPNLIVC